MPKESDSGSERFHKREEQQREHRKHVPGEDEEPLPPPVEPIKAHAEPGRNDPCSCGSGKKFKKCCGRA